MKAPKTGKGSRPRAWVHVQDAAIRMGIDQGLIKVSPALLAKVAAHGQPRRATA